MSDSPGSAFQAESSQGIFGSGGGLDRREHPPLRGGRDCIFPKFFHGITSSGPYDLLTDPNISDERPMPFS